MIVRRVFVLHVAEFLMGMVVCLRNMRMRMSGIVAGMRRRVTVLVSVRVTMAVRVGMAVHKVPVPMQVLVHVIVRMGVLVGMRGGCFRFLRHGVLRSLTAHRSRLRNIAKSGNPIARPFFPRLRTCR